MLLKDLRRIPSQKTSVSEAWRCEVEHVFASTLDDQSSEQVERVEGLLEAKVERQSALERRRGEWSDMRERLERYGWVGE